MATLRAPLLSRLDADRRVRHGMGGARWCACVLAAAFGLAADISPQQYQAEVNYLASPELKGRATGSPELNKAADFIAAKFKSFGLKPAEQPFPVITGAHLGPNNKLD